MRIDAQTVERIIQATDIYDVVNEHVSLQKKGANYSACCPFHIEKSPSFSVSPTKGIFKCFGCGKAGDAITFVMEIQNINYGEALRFLAKKYNIAISEPTSAQTEEQTQIESLYIVLQYAKNFYQSQLETIEGQTIAKSYLKERGFTETTIKDFEIGYCPTDWGAIVQNAKQQQYNLSKLEEAGIIITKEEKSFDRYRGRIIFPIHNLSGRVIGFGGRVLKNEAQQAKYINSPETKVYQKSHTLYGIFLAKNAIRASNQCYLVEGYTDVLSLHQAGIKNVVASSGTALTIDQIRLLKRFTTNVTLLYDGDAAGQKAALRGIDLILEEGLNLYICPLPEKDDPDSLVRRLGMSGFEEYIEQNSTDFLNFKTKLGLQEIKNDIYKQAEFIKEITETIAKIPEAIKRELAIQKTAQLLNVSESTLIAEVYKHLKINVKESKNIPLLPKEEEMEDSKKNNSSSSENHEAECLRYLLLYGNEELEQNYTLVNYIYDELGALPFRNTFFQELKEYIFNEFITNRIVPNFSLFPSKYTALIANLVAEKHVLSLQWNERYDIKIPTELEKISEAAYTMLLRLKKAHNKQKMDEILKKIATLTSPEEQILLMEEFRDYKSIDMQISSLLGRVI